jgi:tryptophan-rich sensory protein
MVQYIRDNRSAILTLLSVVTLSLFTAPVANMVFRPLNAPEWPVNLAIYTIWVGSLAAAIAVVLNLVQAFKDFTLMKLGGIFVLMLGLLLELGILFGTGGLGHKIVALPLVILLGLYWRSAFMNETIVLLRDSIIYVKAMRSRS